MTREPRRKVSLSKATYERLRSMAEAEGVTLSELVIRLARGERGE